MGLKEKATKVATMLKAPQHLIKRQTRLVLVSHMRARTSLLSHILGSNPEVAGYYEQHISHKRFDIDLRLRVKMAAEGLLQSETRYLFDKTLHTHLDPFGEARIVQLVMLREPAATVASIVRMGLERNTVWQDEELGFAYYCHRLKEIGYHFEQSKSPCAFINSDALVNSPTEILAKLTEFLDLNTALESEYKSFDKTGHAGSGDPSGALDAGKVVSSDIKKLTFENPKFLELASTIYKSVCDDLKATKNMNIF